MHLLDVYKAVNCIIIASIFISYVQQLQNLCSFRVQSSVIVAEASIQGFY